MTARILVVGAGPTGLTAGWKLAQQGHRVSIIERGPIPGGMSASFEIAGQRVDFGSHRLHGRADPQLLAELGELLGSDLQRRERNGRIRLEGRWVAFPLRAEDLIRHLPRRFALAAVCDSLVSPLRRPSANSFAAIVRAGLGPTVFDSFYRPYAGKLWGVEADQLDGSLARRRVSAGGPLAIAKRLLAARSQRGRVFHYPRLGYGQIAEALTDAATEAGAELQLTTTLRALEFGTGDTGVTAVVERNDNIERLKARSVISTIPAQRLVTCTSPTPDARVLTAAEELHHRAMVLVYLVLPYDRYTPYDAHYFPGPDTAIARLSEPKNYRTGPDPIDQTVLCAEIACTVGDSIWTSDDHALGELVARQLAEQGLPRPGHVETHVRRLPNVYPVYTHGYREHLDAIEQWAADHQSLITCGRQGLFVPDNLHHTMAMGRAAAAAVNTDGSIDRQAWRQAREAFRSHVVED